HSQACRLPRPPEPCRSYLRAHEIALERRANERQPRQQLLGALDVELLRIVGVVVGRGRNVLFALFKVFGVVQVTRVGADAVIAAEIGRQRHLLLAEQRLPLLLAVPGTDDVDRMVWTPEQLT